MGTYGLFTEPGADFTHADIGYRRQLQQDEPGVR